MNERKRVLIADDHSLIRKGIRDVLEEYPDLEIVAEVGDGPGLFAALEAFRPDCLLVDITMPNFEPVKAIKQIRASNTDIKILIVSAYDDDVYVQGLLAAGVNGYHLKSQPLAELRIAIERVLAGDRWLSGQLVSKLINQKVGPASTPPLTTRQCDLLRLLHQGLDNQAIANRLGLSVKTVENNLTRLYRYINVQSRLEAVNYVIQHPEVIDASETIPSNESSINPITPPVILLVDDNARFRRELRLTIHIANPNAIIYEAENIAEAAQLFQHFSPQLVFIDMILNNESGIQCTQRLKRLSPQAHIILISAYPDREFHRLGIEAGAVAFLDKKDLDLLSLRQIIADVM